MINHEEDREHSDSSERNLHVVDGGLDGILADYLSQLLQVVHGVELGASGNRHLAAHEVAVEGGVCVGRAVGGDEQLRSLEERRGRRDKPYLAGPLG